MKHLEELLFTPRRPMVVHWCAVGIAAALVGILLGALGIVALEYFGADLRAVPRREVDLLHVFVLLAVLFAPVVETFALAAVISLINRASKSRLFIASTAAVLAGIAHGPYPVTFVAVTPAFFLYASSFLAWRTVTFPKALLAAGVPHAIANILLTSLMLNGA